MAREVTQAPRGADDRESLFDGNFYLAQYADVKASSMNPLQHSQQYGWHEGRDASAQFSTTKYLAAYSDVKNSGVDPLEHFLANGQAEGRSAFNV